LKLCDVLNRVTEITSEIALKAKRSDESSKPSSSSTNPEVDDEMPPELKRGGLYDPLAELGWPVERINRR